MKKMSLLNLILLLVVTFASICVGQATLKVQIKDGKIVSAEKVERDITKKIDYQKNEVANPQMNSVKMQSVNAAPIANATNSNSLLDINLYVFDVNVSDPVGPLISFTIRILSSDNAYVGVAAYLSTDNIITTSDILLTRWQQAQVARDVVTDFSRQDFNIGAAPDGDYYFGAIVDPDNLIVETNESDNTRSSTYADVQKRSEDYDLVIRNINLTDYSLPTLAYSFEVANLGSAGVLATGAVPIKGYLSTDTQITTNDFLIQLALNTQPLGPNQSNTISYQSSVEYLADGYYYLGIIADPSNTIIETNEENNAAYLAEPKVEQNMNAFDITVSSVSIQSVTDDKIYFQCTVTNLGSRGILPLNSFRITGVMSVDQNYTFSDFVVGGWQNSMALGPGEGFTITTWANTSAIQDGDYYFGIVADPENVITETNENNNHMLVSNPMVQIRHAPGSNYELNAVSITVSDYVYPKIGVRYRIRNDGTSGTIPVDAFQTCIYLSSDANISTSDFQISETRNADEYPPGREGLFNLEVVVPPGLPNGDYYIGLIIDPNQSFADNNRGNNLISGGFANRVLVLNGNIDFAIENLNVVDNVGPSITYNYRLVNNSSSATILQGLLSPATYLSTTPTIDQNSRMIDYRSTSSNLAPSEFLDFNPTIELTGIPDGNYYLGVLIDNRNYYEETNENNNVAVTASSTIQIGSQSPPDNFDLAISNLSVFDALGPDLVCGFDLVNDGTVGTLSSNAFSMNIYLSVDQTITTSDFQVYSFTNSISVSPGGGFNATPTFSVSNITDGFYYLGVILDPANAIVETNENNNTAVVTTSQIRIGNPSDIEDRNGIPNHFELFQNFPNPFNPSTTINYQLPTAGFVSLKVYDVLGNEVATLVNEFKQPGNYNSQFSIRNSQLTSGVYFYQINSGDYSQTKKLILSK